MYGCRPHVRAGPHVPLICGSLPGTSWRRPPAPPGSCPRPLPSDEVDIQAVRKVRAAASSWRGSWRSVGRTRRTGLPEKPISSTSQGPIRLDAPTGPYQLLAPPGSAPRSPPMTALRSAPRSAERGPGTPHDALAGARVSEPLPEGYRQRRMTQIRSWPETRLLERGAEDGVGGPDGRMSVPPEEAWLAVPLSSEEMVALVGLLVAAAYPDRIALRRDRGNRDRDGYTLSNGSSARLASSADPLASHSLLAVGTDWGQRSGGRNDAIGLATPLQLPVLERHLPDLITTTQVVEWAAGSGTAGGEAAEEHRKHHSGRGGHPDLRSGCDRNASSHHTQRGPSIPPPASNLCRPASPSGVPSFMFRWTRHRRGSFTGHGLSAWGPSRLQYNRLYSRPPCGSQPGAGGRGGPGVLLGDGEDSPAGSKPAPESDNGRSPRRLVGSGNGTGGCIGGMPEAGAAAGALFSQAASVAVASADGLGSVNGAYPSSAGQPLSLSEGIWSRQNTEELMAIGEPARGAAVEGTLQNAGGTEDLPSLSEAALLDGLDTWLGPFLGGVRTKEDLKALDWQAILKGLLTPSQMQYVDKVAPVTWTTPWGDVTIEYGGGSTPPSNPPSARISLADFLGSVSSPLGLPESLRGRMILYILGPDRKVLADVPDLATFWGDPVPQTANRSGTQVPQGIMAGWTGGCLSILHLRSL
eukprot:jgi/Botrbrau1/12260/Bobra.0323s0003.1